MDLQDTETSPSEIIGHSIKLTDLIDQLKTETEIGLSTQDASDRLEKYGRNAIPQPKQSFWKVYLAPLLNTLIVIYLLMTAFIVLLAVIYFLFIDPSDTSIWFTAIQWLIIVGVNFLIAIIQQQRAQKQIKALHQLSAPSARVIREGKEIEVSTEEVVPGDIILLTQGDKIPADSRIIKSSSFRVNESSLTGESVPTTKVEDGTNPFAEDTSIGDRKNMVYNGTFVTMGTGRLVVVNTGGRTEFGKISLELAELNTGDIPIRQKVNTIGNYLAGGMLIIFSLLLIYQATVFLDKVKKGDIPSPADDIVAFVGNVVFDLSNIIIKAMTVVPINIPLLTTIILITGVLAMAKHKVIIRNLASIESLGRISILCSDKTGTITAGQMTVKGIWDATSGEHYYVGGLGYSPDGKLVKVEKNDIQNINEKNIEEYSPISVQLDSSLGMLIASGMLNNDSNITEEMVGDLNVYVGTGSPTESALIALFNKSGLSKADIKSNYKLLREFPFDSSIKRMSKVFEYNKKPIVLCKGATEVLLPLCSHIGYGKGNIRKITEKDKQTILAEAETVAGQGYRILSLTYKAIEKLPDKNEKEREQIESDLIYLGFVKVLDPPREFVGDSVQETLAAGITPIMITGDSPLTASSIADSIGLAEQGHQTHQGKMAAYLNDPDFEDTRVFARVAPQDKQTIIQRYQNQNRVVAMTGDGVNDALALSMADAGIAMGISGTEVSKQAADLVIADDSFNSIVTGIREGRALFQRIRVIIFFYVAINLSEAACYIGASFISGFIPGFELMDHLQRAYIFAIAHTFPPLALIIDQIPRGIMNRDPIDSAGIFNRKLALTLVAVVVSLASVIYLIYFTTFFDILGVNNVNRQFYTPVFQNDPSVSFPNLRPMDWNHAKARTLMHTVLYLTIPMIILSIRRIDKSLISAIREDSNWITYAFAFSIIPLHLLLMYFPPIQELLAGINLYVDVIGLSIFDWVLCFLGALVPVLVIEGAKWTNRIRGVYY
ncbi:MAG: cation-translocating P-type ATPase [Candidatus Hodarchaeales archaeon]|jgi:Ca2+-transporting ATPase